MSKIIFDYEKISPNLYKLSSVINSLNSISARSRNMDIPYFGHAYYLRGLSATFSSDIALLDSIIENVKNLNSQFEQCLNDNNEDAKKLPNYEMKKRESIIR